MVPRSKCFAEINGLTPLNTARPVYTAQPKPTVHSARSMSHFFKQAQSTDQRPFYKKTALTNRYFHQNVNTVMGHCYTVRPRAINTARLYTAPVNAVRTKRVNVVKTSACWVWRPTRPNSASLVFKRNNYINGKPQQDDTGFIDSGCSRHMTGNIAYLLDFKEFLKDNMYNFDMKNIVPKESLTCLVTKATSDESMLWHKRLGHINFKNINKLVKDNLVREKGIKREYSVARTPQQNGMAERRSRTLIEAARTMLADSKLPTTFWAEAVSTACYVQNRV
ncbi:putative ribonuclease H-like domain-containing protein, partial [Tanacetum coccineum]